MSDLTAFFLVFLTLLMASAVVFRVLSKTKKPSVFIFFAVIFVFALVVAAWQITLTFSGGW